MTKVSINVRGSHSIKRAPQRGKVNATIEREGSSASPVFAAVIESLAQVRAALEAIHDANHGPVTQFSFDQITTSARRPWHERGKQLPCVHTARVSITAEFIEFTELSRWITAMSHVDGFTVHGVDWDLTASERVEIEREARREAVKMATVRAQDYADALGLGAVSARRISDSGMLPQPLHAPMMRLSAVSDALPELDLQPHDIEIRAEVDAMFMA